jgi:ATP-binding cassette subfamily F protein 3
VLLVSHDRALLDAVAERTIAIEDRALNSYDGGWADYVRVRDERRAAEAPAAEPKTQRIRAKPAAKASPPRPSELERLETEIAEREAAVAELERRLAEDWSNVETLAAHKRARDELQSLLERWETLFDEITPTQA